jgi:hypothetical protein
MRWLGLFLTAVGTLISTGAAAQQPPQDGTFVLICQMTGSSNSGGSAWHKDDKCNLPPGFKIDRSYRQQVFQGVSTSPSATTNITTADIPPGIHLYVTGNHQWSVVKEIELVRIDDSDDGPAQRQFRLHTYCGPAGSPGPGCSVQANVYAKKLN